MSVMNKLFLPLFLFICTGVLQAEEDNDILLRGILKLGDSQAFSISNKAGLEAQWLKLGQSYNDYELKDFDEETETLTIQSGEDSFKISMAGAGLENATGTAEERLAEAQEMMQLMNFEQMIGKTMDGQMKAMSDMMRQQMQRMGQEVDEELIQFQGEAMARMFEGIDWKPIEEGMTQAYAEVFTKNELEGMSAFYTSPAGQATLEKMPEIQTKTMQVMMPAIMQASQKMQQELTQFMQERRKKQKEE